VGVLRQSLAILTRSTTDAMEAALSGQLPLALIRPDLSSHSPWRLDDSASAVAHNLDLARRVIATVLDVDGHVVGGQVRPVLDAAQPALARERAPVDFRRFFQRQARRAG
jgi:hypothetical protein